MMAEERYETLQSSIRHHGSVRLLGQLQIRDARFKLVTSARVDTAKGESGGVISH